MFMRYRLDITQILFYPAQPNIQQLAILVTPPVPPGNATEGQCGDGRLAKSVTCQYMAGWDWVISTRFDGFQ
jgi:mannosylglycoprotein endo-beta-mannosidase